MRKQLKRTETVAEYLARGGKVTKLPKGKEPEPDNFVKPGVKLRKPADHEDHRDGQSPNLRWVEHARRR